jgi:RHS repeat-associated protein
MKGRRLVWLRTSLVGVLTCQLLVFSGLTSAFAADIDQARDVSLATAPLTLASPPPPVTASDRVPVLAPQDENGIWPKDVVQAAPTPPNPKTPTQAIAGDTLAPALGGANTDVYDQGPGVGTHVALVYPADVNYQTANGNWRDLSLALTPTADGWTNSNEGTTLSIPSTLSPTTPVQEALSQGNFTIAPVGVKVPGELSGGNVIYSDALPSIDLTYAAEPAGYHEEVVFNSAPALPTLEYQIQTTGLSLATNDAGGIDIFTPDGTVIGQIPSPLAYDASPQLNGSVGQITLTDQGSGAYDLQIALDPTFMATATYPVTLDPGSTNAPTSRDTYIDNANPNTSYEGSDYLKVDQGQKSYVQFDLSSVARSDRLVYDAIAYLWPTSAGTITGGVEVKRVQDSWPATVTWNTAPTAASLVYDNANFSAQNWWTWNVASLYQQIIDTNDPSGWVNHGIRLEASNPKTFCSTRAPVSSSCPSGANQPVLVVGYNDLPPAPTPQSPADGYTSASDSVTLKVQGGSNWPVDINNDDVFVNFQVSDDGLNWTGSHLVYDSPFSDSNSFTVPTGILKDGTQYWWRAQSWDICAPPDGLCQLTDGNNVVRSLHHSLPESFTISLKHLGPDSRYAMFSHDVGSGMTANVNEANGNLYLDVPIASYPTQIGNLGVDLSYNSESSTDYGLSPGWDVALGPLSEADLPVELYPPSGTDDPVRIRLRGLRSIYFPNLNGDVYEIPGSGTGTVRKNHDNSWIYTTPDGSAYSFSPSGNLTKGKPASPSDTGTNTSLNTSYTYTVDTNGHITGVTDPLGRAISLVWNGPNNQLATITSWTGQSWSIAYETGTNKLIMISATVTVPGSSSHPEVEQFSYVASGTGAGLIGQIKHAAIGSGSTGWTVGYTIDGSDPTATVRVATLTAPPGGTPAGTPTLRPWTFSYYGPYIGTTAAGSCLTAPDATSIAACSATSAASSYQTKTSFNTLAFPIRIDAPLDIQGYSGVSTMTWDSNANLLCRRSPAANAVALSCTNHQTGGVYDDLDAGSLSTAYTYEPKAPYRLLTITHPAPDRAGTQPRLRQSYTYDGDTSFKGLWADEFGNSNIGGNPAWHQQIWPINQDWHSGNPPNICGNANGCADDWSMRLTGYLNVPDFNGDGSNSRVAFRVYSADGSSLSIGSKTLTDCFHTEQSGTDYNCGTNADVKMSFSPGLKPITFEYSALTGVASFNIKWDQGVGNWQQVPTSDFSPNTGLVTTVTNQQVQGSTVTDLAKTVQTYNDPSGGDGYKARKLADSTTETDLSTGGASRTMTDVYDTYGRLTSETRAAGTSLAATTTTVYTDNAGAHTTCATSETDPTGAVTTSACDSAGNVTSLTQQIRAVTGTYTTQGSQSRLTTSTYDSLGRPITVDPPGPSYETRTYDASGRPTETSQLVVASPATFACSDATYDDAGHVITQTAPDPAGNCNANPSNRGVTSYTWTWSDHQLTQTDPNGRTWTSDYDGLGRPISLASPMGAHTFWTYRLSSTEDSVDVTTNATGTPQAPVGTDALTKKDILGQVTSTQLESLTPATTTYDVLGDPTLSTDPAGVQTKNVHDNLGELTKSTSAFGTSSAADTTPTYNALGLVASVDGPRTDVDDSSTFVYDLDGRPLTVTSPGAFLPTGAIPPGTSTTPVSVSVVYDDAGERVGVSQPMSTVQTLNRNWTYDTSGRVATYADLKGSTTYTYNDAGLVSQVADPRPQSVFYGYDYLGHEVCRHTAVCTVSTPGADAFTYDKAGNLLAANSTAASFSMTYDNDERLWKVFRSTNLTTPETTYTYNASTGHLSSITDPAGTTAYTYNATGAVATIDDPLGASGVSTYGYDSAGRLVSRTDAQSMLTWTRGYDPNTGLANTQTIKKTGTQTTLGSFTLGYDPAGDVTSKTSTVGSNAANGSWSYAHDALGRMTSSIGPNSTGVQTTTLYGYDGASDRTTTKVGAGAIVTTSYDAAGYPTTATDSTTYTSDKIGDLLKVDRSGTSADEVFGYDAYARLVCAKMATTTTCANTTSPITLTLDAMDRTVNRTFGSSSTNDFYRGLSQDPVKTVAGTTTSLYEMGLDAPMAQKVGSTTRWYLTDLHDDIVGLADLTGVSQGTKSFDPWGQVLATSGGTAALGYQGDLTDPTTAQVDMGTRWYEPALGRFTARDTVFGQASDPASLNQFAYGADAPMRYIDPTGMGWCDPTYPDCSNGMDPTKPHHFKEERDEQDFTKPYAPPHPPIPPPTGAPASAWAVYKNARAEWSQTQGHACLSAAECEADTTANEQLADLTDAQQRSASADTGCHGVLGCLASGLSTVASAFTHVGREIVHVAYQGALELGRCVKYLLACMDDFDRTVLAPMAIVLTGGTLVATGVAICAVTALLGCAIGVGIAAVGVGLTGFALYNFEKHTWTTKPRPYDFSRCKVAFFCEQS